MDVEVTSLVVILVGLALFIVYVDFGLRVDVARQMRDEYENKFPGKCGVCAYHAFGIREGLSKDVGPPNEHACPERMERWGTAK